VPRSPPFVFRSRFRKSFLLGYPPVPPMPGSRRLPRSNSEIGKTYYLLGDVRHDGSRGGRTVGHELHRQKSRPPHRRFTSSSTTEEPRAPTASQLVNKNTSRIVPRKRPTKSHDTGRSHAEKRLGGHRRHKTEELRWEPEPQT